MDVVDVLVQAREAFDRRDWLAAYDGLSAAGNDALLAADFGDLAMAAFLVGRHNDCVQALQRAHRAHLEAGDTAAAVRCAFWLAMTLLDRGEAAVAGGWIARAQRLLEDLDGDTVEHGYVAFHLLLRAILTGDFETAIARAVEVTDYGRRFHEPDLLSVGLMSQGRCLVYAGQVREGLALIDESMVAVLAGELSPVFAGQVYCSSIEACQEVSDYGRVAEWTTALTTWCGAQPGLLQFTGQCALHRGQVMRVRGAFREAVLEFEGAVERYVATGWMPPAGKALAELGDVHRLLGDDAAARAALLRAVEVGHDPQPVQALLALAEGRGESAAASIRRLLDEPRDPIHRSQVLPGAVDVLLATDISAAEPLVTELRALASAIGTPALEAHAARAAGALALARESTQEALAKLRQALTAFLALDFPYAAADARLLLSQALTAAGDADAAAQELEAARAAFAALGARPALQACDAIAGTVALPGGLTAREAEVLRLVASGSSNQQIAGLLHLSEKTVARHLSNIFTKLDVPSRTAAAAYAFEHGLAGASATSGG